jgi:hypothetical protein
MDIKCPVIKNNALAHPMITKSFVPDQSPLQESKNPSTIGIGTAFKPQERYESSFSSRVKALPKSHHKRDSSAPLLKYSIPASESGHIHNILKITNMDTTG